MQTSISYSNLKLFEILCLHNINAGRTTPNVNILEAMCILVRSYDTVHANSVKNCFRKAGIWEETQVASINDEDGPFKLFEEKVNELKSRGLVDGDLT